MAGPTDCQLARRGLEATVFEKAPIPCGRAATWQYVSAVREEPRVTRIVGVPEEDASLLGRFAYRFSRRRFGKVPEPVRATAHHRKVLLGTGRHGPRARPLRPGGCPPQETRRDEGGARHRLRVLSGHRLDAGQVPEDNGRPAPRASPLPGE